MQYTFQEPVKKIPYALFSPPPHLIYIYDGPLDIRIPLTMFYKMCNPLLFILMFISTMLNNSKSVLTADCDTIIDYTVYRHYIHYSTTLYTISCVNASRETSCTQGRTQG